MLNITDYYRNADQNYNKVITSHQWEWPLKSTNNKCWIECGEKGTFLHCWQEYKLVQLLWRTVCTFLKKLKIELPYDLAIPLLRIYLEKMKTLIRKDTCTPVFIAALFTIAKTWEQPKCALIDEWIKKMWYIYTVEYYSATKKELSNAICSNIDGPRDYRTKWSQVEKDILCDITYMWNLKKWYKWTYLQNRNRLTDIENKPMVTEGEGEGGIN